MTSDKPQYTVFSDLSSSSMKGRLLHGTPSDALLLIDGINGVRQETSSMCFQADVVPAASAHDIWEARLVAHLDLHAVICRRSRGT